MKSFVLCCGPCLVLSPMPLKPPKMVLFFFFFLLWGYNLQGWNRRHTHATATLFRVMQEYVPLTLPLILFRYSRIVGLSNSIIFTSTIVFFSWLAPEYNVRLLHCYCFPINLNIYIIVCYLKDVLKLFMGSVFLG